MVGCRRAVRGCGNGKMDEGVEPADEDVRSRDCERFVLVEIVVGPAGHNHDGYGGGGRVNGVSEDGTR